MSGRRYACPFCRARRRTLARVLRHIRKCRTGREMYEQSIFKEEEVSGG